jgi:hypothetical protein
MKGLDIDLSVSGSNMNRIALGVEPSNESKTNLLSDEKEVAFSKKIIEVLKFKTGEHNENCSRKVAFSQLRDIYREASKTEKDSKIKFALARVNMFLKIVRGEKIKEIYAKTDNLEINGSLQGFVLEEDEPIDRDETIDMSYNFYPNEEAFVLAEKDITKHNLSDYDYRDVDDLYLDTEEEIRAEASAWLDNIIN